MACSAHGGARAFRDYNFNSLNHDAGTTCSDGRDIAMRLFPSHLVHSRLFHCCESVSVSRLLSTAIDDEQLATYVGALVLFRCWRFVRITHGLVEVTAEVTAQKYEGIVKIAEQLEEVLAEHERKMAASGRDSDETDSVIEIQTLSKELAEKLIATEDEDKDKLHLSDLKKAIAPRIHKSHHDGSDKESNRC